MKKPEEGGSDENKGPLVDQPSSLAKLMAAAFRQVHTEGKAPLQMTRAVVSLL